MPVDGGHTQQTRREQLRAVWKTTGIKPPELDIAPPEEVLYLWQWLRNFVYPLTYVELEAWSRLRGVQLANYEIEALMKLDRARADD